MIIYTGNESELNILNGFTKNGNRIEVVTDGAGVPYVPHEVVTFPEFQELKPIFDKLKPTEYTPHENE